MAVVGRSQLGPWLRTGRNAKFGHNFGGLPAGGPRNYVGTQCEDKDSLLEVKRRDVGRRYHSSRESRSVLARLTPQEFATLNLSQSQPQDPNHEIADLILSLKGTSLGEIRDKINENQKNDPLNGVINGINLVLGQDAVINDGENVRIDPENVKNQLQSSLKSIIRENFRPQPLLGFSLEVSLAQQIRNNAPQLEKIFNSHKISTASAQSALESIKVRTKRSVDQQNGAVVPMGFDLGQTLIDIVLSLIRSQLALILRPLQYAIDGALNQVDNILRANEYTHEFSDGSVKSYDSNQLASNNPIEDTRSEASCLITSGLLVGVFDGHAGGACAQVTAKRLYHYITACLLPHDHLERFLSSFLTENPQNLLKTYNDKVQFVDDVRDLYKQSFYEFLQDLSKVGYKQGFEMRKALEKAFLRLDADLSKEALPSDGPVNMKTLSVAMSGTVACVAHIDGAHLHVAHVGDCNAVLGSLSETNQWQCRKLTLEHNSYNQKEVERILGEHPHNESTTVLRMERLLGQLAPLRALGDFRYKWSKEVMRDVVAKYFGENALAPHYHTPPYLTALPEVGHCRLTPRDKFLVVASDGLWDVISPLQVVRLVGEHMKGKATLSPLKLPGKNMKLSEINEMLLQRKEGLKTKPKDSNAATHLIRNALGGTEYGIDHGKLSQLLSLPDDVVRVFRDDITVTIVYFDSEYLRHCPP